MMSAKERENYVKIVLVILLAVLGIRCERSFDPLQENDQYIFSIYGALDLHADTQWVRVMPIGETLIPTDPEPKDIEVTLTSESTGEVAVLQDSLFIFGNDAYVWNYWTTMSLSPNETYTIRAEASDGGYSSAQTTVPSSLPLPLVKYSEDEEKGEVEGSSDKPLVRMDVIYHIQEITDIGTLTMEFEVIISLLEKISRNPDGIYHVEFNGHELILDEIGQSKRYQINKRELYIATGSEEWPDLTDLSDDEIVLPDVVSNVENGTGHVAGMAQRKALLRSCYDNEDNLIFCEALADD